MMEKGKLERGVVDTESLVPQEHLLVFIDGTHIKTSVNVNKKIRQEVPVAAARYRDELVAEINADREAHGKKALG